MNLVYKMRKRSIVALGILLCICVAVPFGDAEVPPVVQGLHDPPIGCHMRLYTYRITQSDTKGYECWDYVNVWSCWGRCDSREISDWKFPYKKSYHPVCVHAGRSKAVAMLRNCHPNADPATRRYEYLEANGCHCQTCTSSDTSCEAPDNIQDDRSIKILEMAGVNPDELEY